MGTSMWGSASAAFVFFGGRVRVADGVLLCRLVLNSHLPAFSSPGLGLQECPT